MARLFEVALAASAAPAGRVRYLLHDAEGGLGVFRAPKAYDLIFTTFVLHYVGNWRRLLDDVVESLANGGLLVQAEVIGDFRNLDGQFDVESPMLFRKFWRQYFTERAAFSAWAPAISASDLSLVRTYLRDAKRLMLFREAPFQWSTSVMWGDFCGWISGAPLSSLGAGLTADARSQLSDTMRRWLAERAIPETGEVLLQWGFKILLHSRGTS